MHSHFQFCLHFVFILYPFCLHFVFNSILFIYSNCDCFSCRLSFNTLGFKVIWSISLSFIFRISSWWQLFWLNSFVCWSFCCASCIYTIAWNGIRLFHNNHHEIHKRNNIDCIDLFITFYVAWVFLIIAIWLLCHILMVNFLHFHYFIFFIFFIMWYFIAFALFELSPYTFDVPLIQLVKLQLQFTKAWF